MMKRNLFTLLFLVFLITTFSSLSSVGQTPLSADENGYTQGANNNRTYNWAGPTASTVTATMKVDKNNVGEEVVVFESYEAPYKTTTWASSSRTFSIDQRVRWHKNGGHTGSNTDNVNSYVGWVKLSFSNPVPASEIFIRLYDMDNRGVDSEVPDGYVRFPGSEAGPEDFEQLAMNPASPATATSSTYNSDGSINFGVGAANADRNKYLGLAGKNTKKVSEISIFIRNIGDDVGFEVGWIKPVGPSLPVTLVSFAANDAPDGILLKWRTADEKDFDRFEIEQSEQPQTGFTRIGTVSGGGSDYSYLDPALRSGASYYRLKMIDTDGTFSYSRIVTLTSKNGNELYRVFPNPSQGRSVYLFSISKIESFQLYNAMGNQVPVRMTDLGGKFEFSFGGDAKPGTYFISYKTGGRLLSQQFVLSL